MQEYLDSGWMHVESSDWKFWTIRSKFCQLKEEDKHIIGPNDLEGVVIPHNDVLVFQATVANFDMAWVFVDVGSSVNILFWTTMEQMRVSKEDL